MVQTAQARDDLTGLLSRSVMDERLLDETRRSRRYNSPCSLLLLDLDHFKSINDAFGHTRGDEVLVEFARRVENLVRANDMIFRYGGDEFVLLLPHTAKEQAVLLANRLLDEVRSEPFSGDPPLSLSLSMGVASSPTDGTTPEELFEIADKRHYQAKRAGRGCVVGYDLIQSANVSVDGPSRLIERDPQLETLHYFLNALDTQQRGLLQIVGEEGAGLTRFLEEVSKAFKLRGYGVFSLQGSPALRNRIYGTLIEGRYAFPGMLPLPSQGPEAFDAALQQQLADQQLNGLLITIDDLAGVDSDTLDFLQTLFLNTNLPRLALVYATSNPDIHRNLPREAPLHERVYLQPLSLTGLRTWLRHSLHWELPNELLSWIHTATRGLPGRIRQALRYLLEQSVIKTTATGWTFRQDYREIPLTRLLDQQPQQPRHNLPTQEDGFVGRSEGIQRLKQLLRSQRLISLVGPGGIGKTRLAVQVAAESVNTFSDGVYFVPLISLSSPESLIYTLAGALQISLVGMHSPRDQLLAYLQNRAMLLVFDGFDNLRSEESLIALILDRAPEVRIITTSRDRLGQSTAVPFEISGLDYPRYEAEEHVERYSSVQLFLRGAQKIDPSFQLERSNRQHIARICRLVEGMPLGIELAAAWIRTSTCQAIAEDIENNLMYMISNQPDSPTVPGPPSQQFSLLAIIESFWHMLSTYEQGVLRQLAVFRSGFRNDAARKIAGASPFFLDALVVKGYLRWTPQERYEMHEILRQYAAETLHDGSREQISVRERHTEYFTNFLAQRVDDMLNQRLPLLEISSDLENIRIAWDWAIQNNQVSQLGRAREPLARFYEYTGLYFEGERAFGMVLENLRHLMRDSDIPPKATQSIIGWLILEQARFLSWQGFYDYALQIIESVSELARLAYAFELEAAVFYLRGEVLYLQGRYTEAQTYLQQALELSQQTNLVSVEADSQRFRGIIACERGDYATAVTAAERMLTLSRQMRDVRREARAMNDLGIIAEEQGDYAACRDFYEHYLQFTRDIGDWPNEGKALLNLGATLAAQGHYTQSEAYLEQSLRICRDIGDRIYEGVALENLGATVLSQGDYERARAYFEQQLTICRDIGNQQGEGYALAYLSLLYHQIGEQQFALRSAEQALQIATTIENQNLLLDTLTYHGHILAELGDFAQATQNYERAITLYRSAQREHPTIELLAGLARVKWAQGDLDAALADTETILTQLTTQGLDGFHEPFRVYWTVFQVLEAQQDPRAYKVLLQARELLMARAAQIADAERRRMFLEEIPFHRDLLLACEQVAAGG